MSEEKLSLLERIRRLKENGGLPKKPYQADSNKKSEVYKPERLSLGISNETIEKKIENVSGKVVYRLSYSEISTYLKCPHKWFLSYILKFPGDASEELIFGSSVHDTIEKVLTNPSLRSIVSGNINLIDGVYANTLKEEISKVTDVDLLNKIKSGWVFPTFYKQGVSLLKHLDIFYRFKNYEVIDVEFLLDNMVITETEDYLITFKGFIDLVLKNKTTGRYLILDWKTSKKSWNIGLKEKDKNFYDQLKLYKHFYSVKKGVDINMIDVCFFNLPREEVNKMDFYFKDIPAEEVNEFKKEFDINCEKMLNFNIFAFDKAKHLTKKNFCHRCKYNVEEHCDDLTQYQTVLINQ